MAKELGNSVSEAGNINTNVVKRQTKLLRKIRENQYALDPALISADIPRSTFIRWYQEDEAFRESFHELEDEQMPLLRQTLRELASGVHPSCDGKPDKTVLRYIVGEYDKRKGNEPQDESDLAKDLERMTRADIAAKLT